jgi:hypothetical protein
MSSWPPGSGMISRRNSDLACRTNGPEIALGLDTPATQVFLGAASAHAGDRRRAVAVLRQLQSSKAHVSAAELAILLTALDEREQAFTSLEQAYRAHDIQLQYLGVELGLDPLRSDPRVADLMRRVGLPQ